MLRINLRDILQRTVSAMYGDLVTRPTGRAVRSGIEQELAVEGAELVHLYVDLMNAGAPYTVIKDAVHIHPTMAEALQSVLLDLP